MFKSIVGRMLALIVLASSTLLATPSFAAPSTSFAVVGTIGTPNNTPFNSHQFRWIHGSHIQNLYTISPLAIFSYSADNTLVKKTPLPPVVAAGYYYMPIFAYNDTDFYFIDTKTGTLYRFDSDGVITAQTQTVLSSNEGLFVDEQGGVFVSSGGFVTKYSQDLTTEFPRSADFFGLRSNFVVTSSGHVLYGAGTYILDFSYDGSIFNRIDLGHDTNDPILALTPGNDLLIENWRSALLTKLDLATLESSSFCLKMEGLACSTKYFQSSWVALLDGTIVAKLSGFNDGGAQCKEIVRVSGQGEALSAMNVVSFADGIFSTASVTTDSTGRIYIFDWISEKITIYEADGRFVSSFFAEDAGNFGLAPRNISVSNSGVIFVTFDELGLGTSLLKLFNTTGVLLKTIECSTSYTGFYTVALNDGLLSPGSNGKTIYKIDLDGNQTSWDLPKTYMYEILSTTNIYAISTQAPNYSIDVYDLTGNFVRTMSVENRDYTSLFVEGNGQLVAARWDAVGNGMAEYSQLSSSGSASSTITLNPPVEMTWPLRNGSFAAVSSDYVFSIYDQIPNLTATPTPSVSGEGKFGSTLTAITDDWDAGVHLVYQWNRDGSAIPGATQSTYALTLNDIAKAVSVTVTGTKQGFATANRESASIQVSPRDLERVTPVINGAKLQGTTVTASSSWGLEVTKSYQWLRDGGSIPGATSTQYTIGVGDIGHQISVQVTGSRSGYADSVQASASYLISRETLTLTPTPVLIGSGKVGTLVSSIVGSWDDGVTLGYQWYRDAAPISGATSPQYNLMTNDLGKQILLSVTGTKPGYSQVIKVSSPITISVGLIAKTPTPVLLGVPSVGKTLKVNTGVWTAGVKLAYQWLLDGKPIAKALSSSILLTKAMKGHKVSVKVSGSLVGFAVAVKTSASLKIG